MAQNPQTGTYRCDACGKMFNSQYDLREHEKNCRRSQRGGPTVESH